MLLDDEMIITDENGEEKTMKILFTYDSEQFKKNNMFFSMRKTMKKMY